MIRAVLAAAVVVLASAAPAGAFTFEPATVLEDAGYGQPTEVALGDFTRDGLLDLAFVDRDDLRIIAGTGPGTFGPPAGTLVPGMGVPNAIRAGDLDADGDSDLAVLDQTGFVRPVLNTPGGLVPQTATPLEAGGSGGWGAFDIGDVDGDGRLDVAAASFNDGHLMVLRGAGDGTFTPSADVMPGDGGAALALADLDGDGRDDVALADAGPETMPDELLHIRIATPTGNLSAPTATPYALGDVPQDVATGDVDEDGNPDVAVAVNNGIEVFRGLGTGQLATPPIKPAVTGPFDAVKLADIDGDGHLDIVATRGLPDEIFVLTGDGRGGFDTSAPAIPGGNSMFRITVGDLDGDAQPDAVAPAYNTNTIQLFRNPLAGDLAAAPSPLAFGSVALGTSAQEPLELTSSGTGRLALRGLTLSGPDATSFSVNPGSCAVSVLVRGATCTALVAFTPAAVGARSALLTIASNRPGGPASVDLTATATPAVTCVVPRLKGLTRKKAKRRLIRRNCALGKVRKAQRRRGRKLVVRRQSRKAGTVHPAGTKVAIRLKPKRRTPR